MNTTEQNFETLVAWIREKPERLERVWAFLDAPTFDDIDADAAHLHRLLDVLAGYITENGNFQPDGKPDPAMETISALAIIARDHAAKIVADFMSISEHGLWPHRRRNRVYNEATAKR